MKQLLLAAALWLAVMPVFAQSEFLSGSAPNSTVNRAPLPTDDANEPLPVGASWLHGSDVYQLQDNTAGYAMWQPVQSNILPLDTIHLNVTAVAITAAGTNYNFTDKIWLPGGLVLQVTSTGTGGTITGVSIFSQTMYGCVPTGAVAQKATNDLGTGATFTLTVQAPIGYGTRKLSRCYSGNAMTVARSDTTETLPIGFTSDGGLDTSTLDGFASSGQPMATYPVYNTAATPRIAVWNDQGGGGLNATGAAGSWPTISPSFQAGNSRPVMFDSHGQANSWDAPAAYLTLPSGVSVNVNSYTAAAVGGALTTQFRGLGFVSLGCLTGGCVAAGLNYGAETNPQQLECDYGGGDVALGVIPTDTPFVGVCSSNGTNMVVDAQNHTATGGAGYGTIVTGGSLGQPINNANMLGGLIYEDAVIIVPYAISTAERLALEASLYRTFNVVPQQRGVIVALGDSHVDGWGVPFQQSWPRMMMRIMSRPDIALVNAGQAGQTLSALVASTSWNAHVAPALTGSTPFKYVLLQGGYNDLQGGSTVAQVEASYTLGITEAHTAGAKAVCVTDVIRNGSSTLNQNMQAVAAWLRTPAAGCDALIDLQAYSVFNNAAGPWSLPWFEQQDNGVHLSAAGNALVADIAAKTMARLLP